MKFATVLTVLGIAFSSMFACSSGCVNDPTLDETTMEDTSDASDEEVEVVEEDTSVEE